VGKYAEFLYDDIGNQYVRKNLYLKEIAIAQDKAKLKTIIKNKKNHPYNMDFMSYKKEEKNFLNTLNAKSKIYASELPKTVHGKLKHMKVSLFKSEEKIKFYLNYIQLTYDAELEYETNKIKVAQLPEIIAKFIETQNELESAKNKLKTIDPSKEIKIKEDIRKFKIAQNEHFDQSKHKLKEKRKNGLISEKALVNGIKELKLKRKESITLKKYASDKRSTKEFVKNRKYILSKGIKRELNVVKSNMADVRRKTPIEANKKIPFISYLTVLVPGLGQLLNRQYFKAILFALSSVYIYLIAIPYALGYGNYQGEGISGLISLAEDGLKIDQSLIFMIEGILAIFFLIFALAFFLLSFSDVRKVEKDIIKGIRPRNRFETLSKIEQEGFPYLVSLPALILTVFVVLVPIMTAVLLSFTGMAPKHQSKFGWVLFDNYKLIATGSGIAGSVFWSILWWTLIWTVVATSLAIFVGFMLAIIANNERIRGKAFFRIVYLLPWAVPAFITIMFFSIMFSPDGAITTILRDVFKFNIEVKNDPTAARIVLILLQTWLGSSYVFLLSTGVLQAIPGDLYEAAQIDGATEWQKLKRITMPLVLFQTAPLLVGQYTFNFNNFSVIYLFNSGGPFNPSKYGNLAGSTDLLISYIYKLTMENQYQAIGATISIVISMGLMLFAFIGFKNSKAFKEERL